MLLIASDKFIDGEFHRFLFLRCATRMIIFVLKTDSPFGFINFLNTMRRNGYLVGVTTQILQYLVTVRRTDASHTHSNASEQSY